MSNATSTPDTTTVALMRLVEAQYDEIRELMDRFEIPPEECEEILDDVVMVLVHRYDQLADPQRWLLRTLRERCLRFLRQRRATLAQRTEVEIDRWLTVGPTDVRDGRRQHLHDLIDHLPRACRAPLRRRWPATAEVTPRTEPSAPSPGLSHPLQRTNPVTRCIHLLLRFALDTPSDA